MRKHRDLIPMNVNVPYRIRYQDPKKTNRVVKFGYAMKITPAIQLKQIMKFVNHIPEYAYEHTDTIMNIIMHSDCKDLYLVRFPDMVTAVSEEMFTELFYATRKA
ncbi:hypothetical protein P162_0061 [Lactococcus phage P162]|uniref:Uncharacterized protein n=1 Tax=Lactococcus phage P162 TaxID=1476889 RepID=X4YV06_9CAUD|nr:hypothetical protein GJ24_gp61 [Lactococcus phage P162]AHV83258.1 hypothetical protein P162_0061 [Lactococcus phage P162]